ncbi:hypothetical protein [Kitasatospora sp. NPDC093102]|uniref:hypothetical protein n=1 Tax=Kitasatospora sp. NPDC093102 TaxID=3155069 RepID=UPI00343B8879
MRRPLTAVPALLAAVPLLAGCSSGTLPLPGPMAEPPTERPKLEIALPADDEAAKAGSAYPTDTVTLAVGQRFGVRVTEGARPWAWSLTEADDGPVLKRGPEVNVVPCTDRTPGCTYVVTRPSSHSPPAPPG